MRVSSSLRRMSRQIQCKRDILNTFSPFCIELNCPRFCAHKIIHSPIIHFMQVPGGCWSSHSYFFLCFYSLFFRLDLCFMSHYYFVNAISSASLAHVYPARRYFINWMNVDLFEAPIVNKMQTFHKESFCQSICKIK